MTSMVMLGITIEVSVNSGLPLKDRTQAWLGHFWELLGTLGHFWKALLLGIGKLCSFGLWAKFTKSKK